MPKGMAPQIKYKIPILLTSPSSNIMASLMVLMFHVRLRFFHPIMIDPSTAFLSSPILHHLRYVLGGACSILAAVKTWAQGRKHSGQALILTRCLERHDKSFLVNKLDFCMEVECSLNNRETRKYFPKKEPFSLHLRRLVLLPRQLR